MDFQTMRRLWIKAAIEHRVVRVVCCTRRSRSDISEHDAEPDFVGRSKSRSIFRPGPSGFWAARDRLTDEGPCCFNPALVLAMELTDTVFEPRPDARWMEHLDEYHRLDLRDETF